MSEVLVDKPFKSLGFKHLETVEIVTNLNTLLCNYQVFFHKLQNYHWNVVGGEFFDLHGVTQAMYEKGLKNIDEIAERVRVFGKVPTYSLGDYISKSTIKQTDHDMSSEFMTRELISDLTILASLVVEVSSKAAAAGDLGTVHMMNKMIKEFETDHWKLTSWVNKKFENK